MPIVDAVAELRCYPPPLRNLAIPPPRWSFERGNSRLSREGRNKTIMQKRAAALRMPPKCQNLFRDAPATCHAKTHHRIDRSLLASLVPSFAWNGKQREPLPPLEGHFSGGNPWASGRGTRRAIARRPSGPRDVGVGPHASPHVWWEGEPWGAGSEGLVDIWQLMDDQGSHLQTRTFSTKRQKLRIWGPSTEDGSIPHLPSIEMEAK